MEMSRAERIDWSLGSEKEKNMDRAHGCIIRLVTLDALQCTENVVSEGR